MGGQGLAKSTGGKREEICSFVLFALASGVQAVRRTGQVGQAAGSDGAGARRVAGGGSCLSGGLAKVLGCWIRRMAKSRAD